MREALIFTAGLVVGTAIGGFFTYRYLKNPKNSEEHRIKDDDIIERINPSDIFASEEEKQAFMNSEGVKYWNKVRETTETSTSQESTDDGNDPIDIYIIEETELGEVFGPDKVETIYWTCDDCLIDSMYTEIFNIESIIGDIDIPSNMGKYEPDSLCIRNMLIKCDYQILRTARTGEEMKDRAAN